VPKLNVGTPNESKIMKNRILSGIAFFTLSQMASAQGYAAPTVRFPEGLVVNGVSLPNYHGVALSASGELMTTVDQSIYKMGQTPKRLVSGSDIPPAIAPRINSGVALFSEAGVGQDSKNFTFCNATSLGNIADGNELFKLRAGNLVTVLRQGDTLSGKTFKRVINTETNAINQDCYHVEFTDNTGGFYTSQYGAPVRLESTGSPLPDGVPLALGDRLRGMVDAVTGRVIYTCGTTNSVYTAKVTGTGRSVLVTPGQITAAGLQFPVTGIRVLFAKGGRVLLRVTGPASTSYISALVEVKAGVVTILVAPGSRNSIAPNASIADQVYPVCVSPDGGWQGIFIHSANYNRYEYWGRSDAFAGFPSAFTTGHYLNTPFVDPFHGTTIVLTETVMLDSVITNSGDVVFPVSTIGILVMNPVIL
jgi:hypothetical protein